MIEPTGTDVVRPAVAADDPDAAPDQVIHDTAQIIHRRSAERCQPALDLVHAFALRVQL
jgi:hypothetical protein